MSYMIHITFTHKQEKKRILIKRERTIEEGRKWSKTKIRRIRTMNRRKSRKTSKKNRK